MGQHEEGDWVAVSVKKIFEAKRCTSSFQATFRSIPIPPWGWGKPCESRPKKPNATNSRQQNALAGFFDNNLRSGQRRMVEIHHRKLFLFERNPLQDQAGNFG